MWYNDDRQASRETGEQLVSISLFREKNITIAVLMTTAIFMVDLFTPLWYDVWVLYLIPLFFMYQSAKCSYAYSAIVTLLIVAGLFVPHSNSTPLMHSAVNRIMGILGEWGVSLLLMQLKHLHVSLLQSHDELEERVVDRTAELSQANLLLQKDIAEKNKLEEVLRDTREIYLLHFHKTPVGIFNYDTQLILTACNNRFMEILQASQEKLLGLDMKTLKDQSVVPAIRKAIEGDEGHYEGLYRATTGTAEIWILMHTVPIFDQDGKVTNGVGTVEDITERKQEEEELRRYRKHLEEQVNQRTRELAVLHEQLRQSQKLEAIGILAGGIAHEFNNILATMKGAAYLIQKKLQEDSPLMKYAEQLLTSIGKANNLSQGLLAFSRKQTIALKPLHFNEAISKIAKLLVPLIGEHIELTLISVDRDVTVIADANQIEQVLVNLVTNARDAMPDGGKLTIRTDIMGMNEEFIKWHGYGIPGEYAVLIVTDTGIGMEEGVREKIFQPFYTTKSVGKGSGLGLAVTYGIVKQHNGFIDTASLLGEGTTFTIYLPAVDAEVSHDQERDLPSVKQGGETILFAEDDTDTRAIMSELLEMMGYTVLVAGDGEAAMSVFEENKDRVQLVLVDVRMPKKNGRAVYDEIKRVYPGMKFLFFSGYTADIIDSHGLKEEGFNFISKTALPDEILKKIREVLDKRENE